MWIFSRKKNSIEVAPKPKAQSLWEELYELLDQNAGYADVPLQGGLRLYPFFPKGAENIWMGRPAITVDAEGSYELFGARVVPDGVGGHIWKLREIPNYGLAEIDRVIAQKFIDRTTFAYFELRSLAHRVADQSVDDRSTVLTLLKTLTRVDDLRQRLLAMTPSDPSS